MDHAAARNDNPGATWALDALPAHSVGRAMLSGGVFAFVVSEPSRSLLSLYFCAHTTLRPPPPPHDDLQRSPSPARIVEWLSNTSGAHVAGWYSSCCVSLFPQLGTAFICRKLLHGVTQILCTSMGRGPQCISGRTHVRVVDSTSLSTLRGTPRRSHRTVMGQGLLALRAAAKRQGHLVACAALWSSIQHNWQFAS